MVGFFFFFKQKTAYEMRISDWSSDVCSSDLAAMAGLGRAMLPVYATALGAAPDYFDGKFDDALAWLRLIHYPTVEDYEEDRFGLGAHTDSGFLTLLPQDRKSVGEGKRGSVRVDLGGRRSIKKKQTREQ